MRRIPRLRRPSGLSTSTSRSATVPLVGQCPFSSSPSSPAVHRRPVPAKFQCTQFGRLYSSDRQASTQNPENQSKETKEALEEELAALEAEGLDITENEVPQQWSTYAPPPQRSHAERFDEVSDPSYVPAMTSEGLDSVGGLGNWWDQQTNWPKSADFTGFKPLNKVVDPVAIETAVRRAVVEAFALRQAGREDELVGVWPTAASGELSRLLEVDIKVTEDGAVALSGDLSAVLESLSWKDEPSTSSDAALSTEEAQRYKESWGNGWKAASLSDPRIKFAVTKRVFQLTGQLVPDHQLLSINDVRSLLHVVQTPPKSKTLTQEIQERRQDLVQLPNVSVATKRVTRGDKEKAVGRFKLVEEELKKRDLPLEGHGFTRKNRELSRLKGGV
ncbi:hypothetical protein M426DRAFT_324276 [Hypoxylon sp. CI-4A]|nr:hypothetical protein M426DRAFT_324276 [Hypoxylon sp. CI-4A]